ncbi:uncharacterized protein EDB91DRAFT_126353 [Suillus paluster]|uniref:uncharacterized protein n=1 Tax=Suillus paluster TaxID=48578 RepID=UPI001B869883|nr:uncharacterized protein EDB91DRAFT_126353 [Suillus paluster]KAG1745833.1 hypothetical protein EDB91DRAFT_126353 [Suillus paluster]
MIIPSNADDPLYFPFCEPSRNEKRFYLASVILSPLPISSLPLSPQMSAPVLLLSIAVSTHLLQTLNIEGHTALYWAILNDRRKALAAFTAFIPQFLSVWSFDLRLASMMTSDQALFTQLNLRHRNCKRIAVPAYALLVVRRMRLRCTKENTRASSLPASA